MRQLGRLLIPERAVIVVVMLNTLALFVTAFTDPCRWPTRCSSTTMTMDNTKSLQNKVDRLLVDLHELREQLGRPGKAD